MIRIHPIKAVTLNKEPVELRFSVKIRHCSQFVHAIVLVSSLPTSGRKGKGGDVPLSDTPVRTHNGMAMCKNREAIENVDLR